MLSENEKNYRQSFYRETGKTPEREARDSATSLGIVLVLGPAALAGLILAYIFA